MKNTERFQKIRRNTFTDFQAKIFVSKKEKARRQRIDKIWENWHECQDILQEMSRDSDY